MNAMLPISIVILTFNAADTIGATLASAVALSDDVHVVDSGSTDATLEIARSHGAKIVSHPFENYGAQRNWAIDSLPLAHGWELHLDADERISAELAAELGALFAGGGPPDDVAGYYVRGSCTSTASRSAMAACGRSSTCGCFAAAAVAARRANTTSTSMSTGRARG
jgi:glycosyltransferase involved in cell wall biosynthesis